MKPGIVFGFLYVLMISGMIAMLEVEEMKQAQSGEVPQARAIVIFEEVDDYLVKIMWENEMENNYPESFLVPRKNTYVCLHPTVRGTALCAAVKIPGEDN